MSVQANGMPTAEWARRYIETFSLALVPIEPGEKGPKGKGWNRPGGYITDAAQAADFWQQKPEHNLGVVLGPSRICSLDVDDVQWTRHVLYDLLEIDLDAMALVFPTVVGNPTRFRIMFRVPDGVDLSRHSLAWPNEKDPDGSIHKALTTKARAAKDAGDVAGEIAARAEADEYQRITVFELRGGLVQDVLPPSIHPGTGKPYTWRTPPSAVDGLPELTPELLAIWNNWDIFKRDAEAACPWAPKLNPAPGKPINRPAQPKGKQPSVIDEFNRCHDVQELLRAHGYIKRGIKWLYPQSSTGLPGITVSEGKVYSHHGADRVCRPISIRCSSNGAFAAMSAIPIIGPVLGVAAAAAAGAFVFGLVKNVASAEGGYDIPAGTNPMTQLHEQEMVLPKQYANVIRQAANGDGQLGGGNNYHYNDHSGRLTPADIRRNARVFAEEMQKLRRNGAIKA